MVPSFGLVFQPPVPTFVAPRPAREPAAPAAPEHADASTEPGDEPDVEDSDEGEDGEPRRTSRRRRGGRGRRTRTGETPQGQSESGDEDEPSGSTDSAAPAEDDSDESSASSRRRRRRRRGSSAGESEDAPGVVTRVRESRPERSEVVGVRGSTRLEAKKQRRREGREAGRRRTVITEAEFLARRESVDRIMLVRQIADRTQIAVLEDGVLVEHYVSRDSTVSMAGNIYLGRVQNVLPSMEAAFVDIGRGRNAVLYAGEVNWDAAGLEVGSAKRIENALESGQSVLVQVTKDPIGHKGARLTSQISLPGPRSRSCSPVTGSSSWALITSNPGTVAQMSKLPSGAGAAAVADGSAAAPVAAGEGEAVAEGDAAGESLLHAPRARAAASARPARVRVC